MMSHTHSRLEGLIHLGVQRNECRGMGSLSSSKFGSPSKLCYHIQCATIPAVLLPDAVPVHNMVPAVWYKLSVRTNM